MVNNILLHRKDSIILAAIEIIDEVGIHSVSTREVAKRVGISEPAIFKHFKTKSDLILAVLEHYTKYDMDVIQSIRRKALKPRDAIMSFIETYATYYENYPQITALPQSLDLLRNDPNLSSPIDHMLNIRTNFLMELLNQAKAEENLTKLNSEYLAITLMGLVKEWCLRWRISNHAFPLKEKIMSSAGMLLDACEIT